MCLCSINVSGRLEKVLISEHLMSGSISLMNGKWRRLKVNINTLLGHFAPDLLVHCCHTPFLL